MDFSIFLEENQYVDFSSQIIKEKASELFLNVNDDIEKARIAYEFVRDEIPHSFDINAKTITARASDVLKHMTGICHAKANLLAALLRLQGIPVGFCYQYLTLADDDSLGYCVHCYNAIFVDNHWIKVDARGNKDGVDAQFSFDMPILAFPVRAEYGEYFWDGIYAKPNIETMKMLEKAEDIQYIIDNIPCMIVDNPDIMV